VAGSVVILSQAIPRLIDPQEVHPEGMLGFAILGIIVNGVAAIRLRKGSTLNEKVASWHLLEDVLGWVAVLIVSIVLLIKDLPILDPMLSLVITAFVLYNVSKNLRKILRVFLQGVPNEFSIKEIEEELSNLSDVEDACHTHIWSLEGQRNLLSIHLIVKDEISRERIIEIKAEVTRRMEEKGIDHVTVQVDFLEEKDEYGVCDDK
jgi:cobalt-zinc-cadmium efflux system protein